jgi:hypothetical protein
MEWMGLMMVCYAMALKRMGMLRDSVRKMQALPVKEETMIQIGEGRWNLTCFAYEVYAVNSKIFFLGDVLFWGGHFRFG